MNKIVKLRFENKQPLLLEQVRRVRVITNDSDIGADAKDFFRIGRAKKYIFLYGGHERLAIDADEILSVEYIEK